MQKLNLRNNLGLIIITVLALAALIAAGVFTNLSKKQDMHAEEIHIHAAFAIYDDNSKIDLAKLDYMHLEFCNTSEEEHTDEQLIKAHLHDLVGDVVHVHRKGATWGDLITNLKLKIDKKVTGYIDGKEVPDILNTEISPYARVVIAYGNTDDLDLKSKLIPEKDYIQKIETKSESCGSKGS